MTATSRELLKWELCWIPVEMGIVGVGVLLLHLAEAGGFVLFVGVALSLAVRAIHYSSSGLPQPPAAA